MALPQEVTNANLSQRPPTSILKNRERRDEHSNFLPRERSRQMVRRGSLCETRHPRHYMRWVQEMW